MHAHIRATLKSGDASKLRDEDLPSLPAWFPLPMLDDDGREIAIDSAQRDALRAARARLEALQGPFDGRRELVALQRDGSPPRELVLLEGRCIYTLDELESNKHHATYRYSPQLSLMHHNAMRAVEDGFNEYGKQYAQEARHDDENADGYQYR